MMIVVTGLASHASSRSRMRSFEPTSEISSANSVGTSGIASSRRPSKNSSWIWCASASKPMRLISSMWKLRSRAPIPPM